MREVEYADERGRRWVVWLPDGVPDSEAARGMVAGPVDLDPLGLPEGFAIRLHNALVDRRILNYDEAVKRQADIAQAVRVASRADVKRVLDLFRDRDAATLEEPSAD